MQARQSGEGGYVLGLVAGEVHNGGNRENGGGDLGIDILIPVLGRPGNAKPVVDSIVENTKSAYQIIFICSPGDDEQIKACTGLAQNAWTVSWPPRRADFAKKINWAFDLCSAEWSFQGADDIRFYPGWDEEALKIGTDVIGTNDLHNPGVKQQTHSTHSLFRRSYILQQGGTFDGSGLVFSEAYDHQYVDNEFIQTAQDRGVFGFAEKSIVEHLHPHWGNAESDATYEKALRNTRKDAQIFATRRRARLRRMRRR